MNLRNFVNNLIIFKSKGCLLRHPFEIFRISFLWQDQEKNKTINIEKILIYNKSESLFLQSPKTSSSIRKIAMGDILLTLLKNHKEWQNNNKKELYYSSFFHIFTFSACRWHAP